MTEEIDNAHKLALRKVQWALQESYPMAVRLRGITDWSKFKTREGFNKASRYVEDYQLRIATMILKELAKEIEK